MGMASWGGPGDQPGRTRTRGRHARPLGPEPSTTPGRQPGSQERHDDHVTHGARERRLRHEGQRPPPERPGPLTRAVALVRTYLPRGNTLDDVTFRQRHDLLIWVLALHVPGLLAFGTWQGYGLVHSALESALPAVCVVFARLSRNRRLAGFFVTAGLVYSSSVLVHLSGGTIEAHFHFFILIGLIALYQDWVPFIWNALFTLVSHGIGGTLDPDGMYNHYAAQNRPWLWAAVHGVSVLAACVGVVVFWKHTEIVQQRNTRLATDLATAQTSAAQRQSVSELFVNLARRNQSLLDRQLDLIAELEQRERTPDALADLFKLDHLATRIRRNAESLLVLSGEETPRRWGRPIALADVVRAAAAEVEDFGRVDVLVNDHLVVAGRAVADLAHLLAELIENATAFSPPGADVRVVSHLSPGPASHLLSVEDTGVGMAPDAVASANTVLADPPEVDLRQPRLGLHVVGRLARRYGIRVQLAPTPGGGVTALVTLPDELVSEAPAGDMVAAGVAVAALGSGPTPAVHPARPPDGRMPPGPARRPAVPPGSYPFEDDYARAETPWMAAPLPPVASTGAAGVPPTASSPPPVPPRPLPAAAPEPPLPPLPPVGPDRRSARPDAADAPEPGDRLQRPPVGPDPRSAWPDAGFGPDPQSAWPDAGFGPDPRSATPDAGFAAQPAVPPITADGLVRRVPGANLSPSLRRPDDGDGDGDGVGVGAGAGSTGNAAGAGSGGFAGPGRWGAPAYSQESDLGPHPERDTERMRSMLSRFQTRQRAGRLAAQEEAAREEAVRDQADHGQSQQAQEDA
jgi:signal transduction histidine kinase